MDYKLRSETVKWHVMHSDFSGSELKVVAFMATAANYKTGKISISYQELADALRLSKHGVQKAVAKLIGVKAIVLEIASIGRTQATYRVRTSDELNAYFMREVNNVELDIWMEKERELFGGVLTRYHAIGEDCQECEELPNDQRCSQHTGMLKLLHDSMDWREYSLWKSDNPRPPMKIKQINGRTVKED